MTEHTYPGPLDPTRNPSNYAAHLPAPDPAHVAAMREAHGIDERPAHMRQEGLGPIPPQPEPVTYVCDLPPSRMIMSLTGFDEIAIAVRFGQKIGELREDAITAGRALAFVHERRRGAKDPDAYEHVMSLTMQEVMGYFAPEPKEQLHGADGATAEFADHPDGRYALDRVSAEGN